MDTYIEKMVKNKLFRNLTEQDFKILLEPGTYILGQYMKNAIIVQENDPCRSIGFILEGKLSVQQLSHSGEMIKIQTFRQGNCFGQALLYSPEPVYPYTLIASSRTSILYILFSQVEALLKMSFVFNRNYIAFLSDRMNMFQNKIRILSQNDVRSRLILYLFEESGKCGNLSFKLPYSKTEIADMIGVARPSVSRELRHMQEDGLLELDHDMVTIKKPEVFSLQH